MFESLGEGLRNSLSFFRGKRLTEGNIRDGLKQVRQALLEADVAFDVARDFIATVEAQAVGDRVLKSMKPDEQILGIVYQELVNLMGPEPPGLNVKRDGVTVLMMCGLQGSGKTTTCGKLAKMLKADNLTPMLVAADLQRPAAIEQLKTLGAQIGVEVHAEDPQKSSPVQVCKNGVKAARSRGDVKVVILDTAGRLHIDDALMKELQAIDNKCAPDAAYMVCDAMTGQDAVNSAKAFNEALELDGVILTKLDGDTRGGAALSVKAVTGVPLTFMGTGEDLDGLEPFNPEGMASRILGQGDLGELARRMQGQITAEEQQEIEKKMLEGKFTLNDFLGQMKKLRGAGPLRRMMKLIPGFGDMEKMMPDMDPEKDLKKIEGMIHSMTPDERNNPEKIDRSRRNRIANGSGFEPSDVNELLKQFKQMGDMMKQMAGKGMRERMQMAQEMMQQASDPSSQSVRTKGRTRAERDVNKLREDRKKKKKQSRKSKKRNR